MEYNLPDQVKWNLVSLLNRIEICQNEEQKAYLNLRLYLLLTFIQNNYPIERPDNQSESQNYSSINIDEKFKNCVTALQEYFNCSIQSLPSHVLSSFGKDMVPEGEVDKLSVAAAKHSLLYLTRNEASLFKTTFTKSKVFYKTSILNNDSKKATHIGEGQREFVLSLSGELYIFDNERRQLLSDKERTTYMKHSSFLSGDEVMCAGMITIKNNKIVSISNDSGHYKPSHKDIAFLLQHLETLGINISEITLNLRYPKLNIKANLFLTLYPELQKLSNSNWHKSEDKQRQFQLIKKAINLASNPNETIHSLLKNLEDIESEFESLLAEKYSEQRINLKTNQDALVKLNIQIDKEKNQVVTEYAMELWLKNFSHAPHSAESKAFLSKAGSQFSLKQELFDSMLQQQGFPSFKDLCCVEVDSTFPDEITTAEADRVSSEVLSTHLFALKKYIMNNPWKTSRPKIGFFNSSRPSYVEEALKEIKLWENSNHQNTAEVYHKIITRLTYGADHPSWSRSPSTQEFYDKVKNHQLLELITPYIQDNQVQHNFSQV